LVVKSRTDLAEHKLPFAQEGEFMGDLLGVISRVRPTVLIGASGQPGIFSKPVLELMAKINERPVILALSNPTSKSECTAQDALVATGGKALFASGSPFGPVPLRERLSCQDKRTILTFSPEWDWALW
jgi:malate dehydrogenase (oxaloacetate-decarboxylating)(NADP+)